LRGQLDVFWEKALAAYKATVKIRPGQDQWRLSALDGSGDSRTWETAG
jgi:hypothetical protein